VLFLFCTSAVYSTVFMLVMCMYEMSKKSLVFSLFVLFSDVHPLVLCFRVKYYPSDPLVLREELSR